MSLSSTGTELPQESTTVQAFKRAGGEEKRPVRSMRQKTVPDVTLSSSTLLKLEEFPGK